MEDPIGVLLGQRLTAALCGHGLSYKQVSEIVYGELEAITHEYHNGDWIAMPNGDMWTKTFTVTKG